MKRPSIKEFQHTILSWYRNNGRHNLPWRHTQDPYRILVSEIMLQQTQVDRVIEKYKEFLRTFPTAKKLARAPVDALLRTWKGLGYNRRALNLQRAAQMIVSDYAGSFPRRIEDIEKLPGVGPYTARAIATFAFRQPHVFIETNIRRIFISFFFHNRTAVSDEELKPFIQKALFKKDPYAWYSALMDYGALAMKDMPNPNKKSTQYVRQSRFEGSQRYARAKTLEFLLNGNGATTFQIVRFFQKDPYLIPYKKSLTVLLKALSKEGFIVLIDDRWQIKK